MYRSILPAFIRVQNVFAVPTDVRIKHLVFWIRFNIAVEMSCGIGYQTQDP